MDEQLSWLQAIVLGISQGLTEFLPISSTAHTLIVSKLLGWPDPGAAFTAVTQVGTELAVVIYFRQDIARILKAWFVSLTKKSERTNPDAKMDDIFTYELIVTNYNYKYEIMFLFIFIIGIVLLFSNQ